MLTLDMVCVHASLTHEKIENGVCSLALAISMNTTLTELRYIFVYWMVTNVHFVEDTPFPGSVASA